MTGHGTATMGVMVGGDAGGTTIGMAPGATWIAAKIFNDCRLRHRDRDPCRPPVGPRPGRQPGHRRRPGRPQQLLGVRHHRLQPRLPAGPPGDPCVGDPARLRGRQLRPRPVDQRQPGELPGVARGRGRRQHRCDRRRPRAAGRRPAASRRPRIRRSSRPASTSARPTCSASTRWRPARRSRRPTSPARWRCSWRPTRGSPPTSRRRRSRRRQSTWGRPDPTTPSAPAASTSSRPTSGWSPTRRLPRLRSPAGSASARARPTARVPSRCPRPSRRRARPWPPPSTSSTGSAPTRPVARSAAATAPRAPA